MYLRALFYWKRNLIMMTPKHNRIMDHGLAGIQHVFVSNVWLDPIYVAAAAGL